MNLMCFYILSVKVYEFKMFKYSFPHNSIRPENLKILKTCYLLLLFDIMTSVTLSQSYCKIKCFYWCQKLDDLKKISVQKYQHSPVKKTCYIKN